MATTADIQWGIGRDHTTVGTLGARRALIRPDQAHGGYEVRIFTPEQGYRGIHRLPTMQEAARWAEQELLRLANDAAV